VNKCFKADQSECHFHSRYKNVSANSSGLQASHPLIENDHHDPLVLLASFVGGISSYQAVRSL
jgi:hypothetical protein